ncbi:hypothetical protein L5515_006932 [Caenorhabditis briggsae]|nr:hypothetical protein L5515_006932 [Caenorhabditis briggsae]
MKNDLSDGYTNLNGSFHGIYDYDSNEKAYILWSVAIGTFLGTFPLHFLYTKFGAKIPFFICGLVSCCTTALIPFSAKTNYYFLILLRFIQGFAYSADFAAIGLINGRWAPVSEVTIFMSILTCFNGIASTITNVGTGLLCESSLGWKWSYYLHSIFGFVLFGLWYLVYIDYPEDTQRVSDLELKKIQKDKSEAHLSKKCDVPYKKLLISPVILCVWLNAFFDLTAAIMFSTYVPIYLHEVLKFEIKTTGFLSSLILGMSIPVRIFFAIISDKVKLISEMLKIHIFNTVSVGVSGVFFASIGFIPIEYSGWSVFCFVMCMCCIGVNSGGFYKSAYYHSRQFNPIVITAIQWIKCLALFVAPALVNIFVSDESNRSQWTWVFAIIGGCMVLTNLISFFILTDKSAEWTEQTEKF